MADENENNDWDFDNFPIHTNAVNNDPWTPENITENKFPKLLPVPQDPLHSLISSETYIESLEKKLKRMKGSNNREIRATDMIQSLQTAKETQVAQMLGTNQSGLHYNNTNVCGDIVDSSVVQSIQRRLNPDKQALNSLELVPLVNADVLAKVTENTESEKTQCDQT